MQRLMRRSLPSRPVASPIIIEIANNDDVCVRRCAPLTDRVQLYQNIIAFIVQDNGRGLSELLIRTNTDVNFCFGRSQRSILHVAAGVR